MKPSRAQLVNLLIGKSILETIFVGVLAVIVWAKAAAAKRNESRTGTIT